VEWVRWVDIPVFLVFAAIIVDRHWAWDARHLIGISMAAAGFALWLTARLQLGTSFSVRPQAKALVTTGLYSRFRNPVYLFGGVAYTGLFIVWGDLLPSVFFLLAYVLYQSLRARKEAAVLEKAFGDDYRRYRARTWL
jgi:protein-S-isoprenylcysteine O-methyltransferase Ste14